MKRLFILLLTQVLAQHIYAQDLYALVVGISEYPQSSGWTSISGANDIDIVVPLLLDNNFAQNNIVTLSNKQATKGNIISAIKALRDKVALDDIVYFHFSGHGQLIVDVDGDEGAYGYDESIIPYDACRSYDINVYTGKNHIVDDELNDLLEGIKQKLGPLGKLIVVLDACHSGGGSRDEVEDVSIRGAHDIFQIPPTLKNTKPAMPKQINWVCISACKSIQNNYEYLSPEGRLYGRLSWAICEVFDPQLTPLQLLERIRDQYGIMRSRYPQEPILDCNNELNIVPIM